MKPRVRPPIAFIFVALALWTVSRIALWGPIAELRGNAVVTLTDHSAPPRIAISTRQFDTVTSFQSSHRNASATYFTPFRTDRSRSASVAHLPSAFDTPHQRLANSKSLHRADSASPVADRAAGHVFTATGATEPRLPGGQHLAVSFWALWRTDMGATPLANRGELGGSQAGIRLLRPIWRPRGSTVSISGRVSRPLERGDGGEAAVGIAIQAASSLPITFTLERRIAIETGGRNAWTIGAAGGVYQHDVGLGVMLDAYAQTGLVGARSRDAYIDGAATLSYPVMRLGKRSVSVGAGIWGGSQPGVSRIDLGPEAAIRFPLADGGMRLALAWRQRVAGSAAPSSGPALTLGADF